MEYKTLHFIRSIPTTKLRILVSILLTCVTVGFVLGGFQPPLDLWAYLLASQGLDAVQYHQNRKKSATEGDGTTDVQELSEEG
jgi:hypothetical protein